MTLPSPTPLSDEALVRKITLRLLPFLLLLYIVAYLDRVNVGFAKLQMNQLPWFSETVFGTGSGIFFFGYFLFEIPSNLILQRVGARFWIMRIMITWGIIAMLMFLANSAASFYFLRFLLGLAEAGFFPGVLLYLTFWFTARERARIIATLMTANAIAFIFGGPLSTGIMQLPPRFGLAPWQQLFILEGIPAVLLGFVVLSYLPNSPEQAKWLTREEKDRVVERVRAERNADSSETKDSPAEYLRARQREIREAFCQPVIYALCGVYFFLNVGMYGISMWLPQIIKSMGNLPSWKVGFLTAIPYFAAGIGLITNGIHSDRRGERRWHVTLPALCGALGLLGGGLFHTPFLSLLSLSVAAAGMWATLGPFWSVPPKALRSSVALAGGIALINSVGNLGGFIGPFAVGVIKSHTTSFTASLCLLASSVVIGALLIQKADAMASKPEADVADEIRLALR